jgi:hypothetical protein
MVIGEMWRGKGFPAPAACSAGRARFQTLLPVIITRRQMSEFKLKNTTQAAACVVRYFQARREWRR